MAGKIMEKVLNFMGFEDEDVDVYEEETETLEPEEKGEKKRRSNLFTLPSPKQMRVVVQEPTSFEDAPLITDNLRNRRPVIVNLEYTDKELAKRLIDFISGATYALSGSMQKIGNNIFLFVPCNVDISGELKEEKDKEKGSSIFTWVR